MATQDINPKLIDKVTEVITSMCDAELKGEGDFPGLQPANANNLVWLRKQAWGPLYETVADQHPSLVLRGTTGITITSGCLCAAVRFGSTSYGTSLGQMVSNLPRHLKVSDDGGFTWTPCFTVTRDDHPDFEKFAKWWDATQEIRGRWLKINDQVTTFLKSNKTLNKAVELWPDVRRYIPQEYIDRIERKDKVGRTIVKPSEEAAKAALAAMDLDVIVSSTVSARLVAAQG